MKTYKRLSRAVFMAKFSKEDACYEYLSGVKWEPSYSSKRCSHENFVLAKRNITDDV